MGVCDSRVKELKMTTANHDQKPIFDDSASVCVSNSELSGKLYRDIYNLSVCFLRVKQQARLFADFSPP